MTALNFTVMLVPAAVFTFLPLRGNLKSASLSKKLFCVFNAAMLCEFCSICAVYITARYRLRSAARVADTFRRILLDFAHVGMSLPIGLAFWRTLTVKIPLLLNEERIASVWRYMFAFPLAMTLLTWWLTPISPAVVMTGRSRQIGFVLTLFMIITVWLLYHLSYWTTARLTESARQRQENTFLQMEAKRYDELRRYMDRTKELRHDFRQHILVISTLAEGGQLGELREYISGLTDKTAQGYVNYCANLAADALASHYDYIAGTLGAKIDWRLELPASLPMKEADYCSILGNLLENSLRAVKSLPSGKRRVRVISSMLSEYMLGLSVDNPFGGTITLGKNGLPDSARDGHGIGLVSVMNTVNRYGGTMNITAEGNIFSADIILYFNS